MSDTCRVSAYSGHLFAEWEWDYDDIRIESLSTLDRSVVISADSFHDEQLQIWRDEIKASIEQDRRDRIADHAAYVFEERMAA